MAIPFLGAGLAIGIGEESTWGTAVARARWERATSSGLRRTFVREAVGGLGVNGPSLNQFHTFTSRNRVGGSLAFFAQYNSYGLSTLLKHAMGTVGTTGAGDPYMHTYQLRKALPTGLTIEVTTADYAEVFEGCKVNRLILTHDVGALPRVEADIIGETSAGPAAAGSPTYVADADYAYIHQQVGGTLSWNSVEYVIRRLVVTIDNKLEARDQIGSLSTLEPVRGAHQEVTFAVDIERTVNTLHTAYLAGTASDATFTFAASAGRSIAYTLQNAEIFDYDPPANISSVGPLVQRVTFRGFDDGTDEGLGVVLVNKNSATI